MQPWRYSDPLVQPDLDYILELCNKHKIRIMLTTNAVSFTKKVCDILNQHHGLISQIFVSVIGFTDEEVWDMMKIKKQKTLKSLEFLKDNYPNLSRKLRIGIKHKDQNAYAPTDVIYEYKSRTYGKVKAKRKWMSNRLGDGDGDWTKPYNATVLEDYFIEGCAMNKGRIMRQMEVLVNGQVLLCCDDADGKTNYGNVFEIGIENAWKNLQKEHTLIYDKKFSDAKKDLICNTCSRGRFTGYWTEDQEQKAIKKQKSIASLAGL
jgi:sulfatase maturation enzyme AslB (radical SAM superfamily)